jgi:hypothetical protein
MTADLWIWTDNLHRIKTVKRHNPGFFCGKPQNGLPTCICTVQGLDYLFSTNTHSTWREGHFSPCRSPHLHVSLPPCASLSPPWTSLSRHSRDPAAPIGASRRARISNREDGSGASRVHRRCVKTQATGQARCHGRSLSRSCIIYDHFCTRVWLSTSGLGSPMAKPNP